MEHTEAAVWRGGDLVSIETVAVPEPGDGEVLVRVLLATVCGSDRHTVSGRRVQPCPSILGHETVGEVVAIGPGGARDVAGGQLRLGQRVIWSVTWSCGTCDRCRAGITAKCHFVRKAGHEALDSGWALSGGYAGHVLLPAGLAIAGVDELDDRVAAPAACATATVMAVMERAGHVAGARVIVIGAGMLGLVATAAAADGAAATVTTIDPDPGRRTLAREFGADAAAAEVDPASSSDLVLEFSGSAATLGVALDTLDVGGVAVLAGSVAPGGRVAVDPERVVRRHLSLAGVHNYEPRHLAAAVAFLAHTSGRFRWADLVDGPRPLRDVAALLTDPPGTAPRRAVAPGETGLVP